MDTSSTEQDIITEINVRMAHFHRDTMMQPNALTLSPMSYFDFVTELSRMGHILHGDAVKYQGMTIYEIKPTHYNDRIVKVGYMEEEK